MGWDTAVGLVDSGRRTSWTGRGDGAEGRAAEAAAGDAAVAGTPGLADADSWVSSGATAASCRGGGSFAAGRTAWVRAAPDAAGLAGRGRTEGGLTISAGRLGGLAGAGAARAGAGRAGAAAAAAEEGATGLAGGAGGSVPEVGPVPWIAFFTARMALGAGVGAVAPPPLLLVRISARMRPASSSLMELLWLRAGMDRVSAASSTSLLSRPRSLDNS